MTGAREVSELILRPGEDACLKLVCESRGQKRIESPDRIYVSAILSKVLSRPSSSPNPEHVPGKSHATPKIPCNKPVRNPDLELNT